MKCAREDLSMASNAFQDIMEALDLEKCAPPQASARNDLLPPRAEDKIGGEVARSFTEMTRRQIERGKYEPDLASIVYVPKPSNATRPAALLTLEDRVVYEALIHALLLRIEKALLEGYRLLARGELGPKRWKEFEQDPVQASLPYVVLADVTGFYESVDHNVLGDILVKTTGKRKVVHALLEFLECAFFDRQEDFLRG